MSTTAVKKPTAKLLDEDGNIYNLIGIAQKALRGAGQAEQAKTMQAEIFASGSYEEALGIIMNYCDVI